MMIRELLFRSGFFLKRPEVLRAYAEAMSHADWSRDQIRAYQDAKVQALISYSFKHVPYYRQLADEQGLTADQFKSVSDLAQLPILTKSGIRDAGGTAFYPDRPVSYRSGSTGGSTGQPLKYRMSDEDSAWSFALLFRGWGLGGYRPGDKLAVIAGASLTSTAPSWKQRLQDLFMNVHHYSSYGMGDEELERYYNHLDRWKPRFVRGYATSLFQLARYVERRGGLGYQIEGVFSTAEVLTPAHREAIEGVFGTHVYNNYGLNDGGISAYECSKGMGMHIDFERGLLEVVDDDGQPIANGIGRIVATSLRNTAYPFVRYDTGDLGEISDEVCPCGCKRPLLINVTGRTTQTLHLNGKAIGSPVLTVLMGKVDVEHYRVRQTGTSKLVFEIVRGGGYSDQDEKLIRHSLQTQLGELDIRFDYVNEIEHSGPGKHMFIVNECEE